VRRWRLLRQHLCQGDGGSNPATLTIGPGITIHGNGYVQGQYGNDSLLNQGTIAADVRANDLRDGASWTNQGTLRASNGGTLQVTGYNWVNQGRCRPARAAS